MGQTRRSFRDARVLVMIRVSVIIPCYNRKKLLPATLESLRGQSYLDWEAVVIDDGSDDGSDEVARGFARDDDRFRVEVRKGELRGANVCRNQGLARARGEYVIFLDSDDLLSPTCLQHRVGALDRAPDCGFGVFLAELFSERVGDRQVLWNVYTEADDLARFLSKDPVWDNTGPIWKREVLVNLGGFDEDLLSFQDWDLHVRALGKGIKYFKSPVRDHFYRNGYAGGSCISSVSTVRRDHLQSHERLFSKITALLRTGGLLNEDHRCRMAGLFWWLAKCRLKDSHVAEAAAVWDKAWSLGLCKQRQHVEGRLMLRMYTVLGGRCAAEFLQLLWPPHLRGVGSEFLHNAPLHGRQAWASKIEFDRPWAKAVHCRADGLVLRG